MVDVYCILTGTQRAEVTAAVRKLLFAPRRVGGRGLRSCEALLERAFLGSQALIAPLLLPYLQDEPADSRRQLALIEALHAISEQVGEARAEALLPVTAATFTSY